MLAFDKDKTMWTIGTESNIGRWNGTSWEDMGIVGQWTMNWLYFS